MGGGARAVVSIRRIDPFLILVKKKHFFLANSVCIK